jgi:ketosteroid isomerase-like protein
MRHLVYIAVLVGTALACRDAAAPHDPGNPAFSSESSDRAALDLREERASLITAGNALSDAIAQQGVAAALGSALTSDALFLSPRVNVLDGSTAVTSFLTTNPLAPSALDWEVFVADVSNDGAEGFTWGQGSSTIDFGAGPDERASFFLIYWRRDGGGDWRVAALVFNAGGPQATPLPAGFGTPDTKHRRNFPNTDVAGQRAAILSVDAAFSAASVSQGSGPAFEQFAAPNAIAVGGGALIFGPEAIGEAFTGGPNDVVSWVPRFAGAAASGDLGFSVGEATFVLPDDGITFYSKYLTIWQKQDTGEWRFVSDLGSSRPAPGP